MMIEIGCLMARIEDTVQNFRVDLSFHAVSCAALNIRNAQTFSALEITAFILVCGCCAAPEEIFSQFNRLFFILLLSDFMVLERWDRDKRYVPAKQETGGLYTFSFICKQHVPIKYPFVIVK